LFSAWGQLQLQGASYVQIMNDTLRAGSQNFNFINTSFSPNNITNSNLILSGNGSSFTNAGAGSTSVGNVLSIPIGLSTSTGNVTLNHINIDGVINTTAGTTLQRGFYYNPTLTGTVGFTHRAIETVTGNVLLGTTSGNVLIGTTTDSGYKLDVNGTARLGGNSGFVTVTSYTAGATTMSVSNVGHHGATAISASSAVGINAISILGAGSGTPLGVGIAARKTISPLVDPFTDADGVVNSTYKSIGLYAERAIISNSGSAFIMTNGTMLHVDGATIMSGSVTANSIPASPNTAYGLNIKNTLVAAANNDSLVALDINPTFTNGAFTGVNNYNIKTRGLLNKMYFQSPTTNQGRHDISFGFGGSGEQVKLIANAMGASGEGDLYISLASGDSAVATTSNANALFRTAGTTFYKTFTLDQTALSSGNGLYLSGNQPSSITNGIYFRFSETRVAILSKPNGGSGYADFRIAIVPLGGGSTNNPPQLSDTKFMITQDTTNVLINTTTDSGYKLDVNGTTRSQGNLTIGNAGSGVRYDLTFNASFPGGGTRGGIVWSSGASILNSRKYSGGNDNTISFVVANNTLELLTIQEHNGTITTNNVGINNSSPAPSAILDVTSTTKGFLPPRVTTIQKNAIASPAEGLMVYDSTLKRPCFFDGTSWVTM